jgi:hypothetical protein
VKSTRRHCPSTFIDRGVPEGYVYQRIHQLSEAVQAANDGNVIYGLDPRFFLLSANCLPPLPFEAMCGVRVAPPNPPGSLRARHDAALMSPFPTAFAARGR